MFGWPFFLLSTSSEKKSSIVKSMRGSLTTFIEYTTYSSCRPTAQKRGRGRTNAANLEGESDDDVVFPASDGERGVDPNVVVVF